MSSRRWIVFSNPPTKRDLLETLTDWSSSWRPADTAAPAWLRAQELERTDVEQQQQRELSVAAYFAPDDTQPDSCSDVRVEELTVPLGTADVRAPVASQRRNRRPAHDAPAAPPQALASTSTGEQQKQPLRAPEMHQGAPDEGESTFVTIDDGDSDQDVDSSGDILPPPTQTGSFSWHGRRTRHPLQATQRAESPQPSRKRRRSSAGATNHLRSIADMTSFVSDDADDEDMGTTTMLLNTQSALPRFDFASSDVTPLSRIAEVYQRHVARHANPVSKAPRAHGNRSRAAVPAAPPLRLNILAAIEDVSPLHSFANNNALGQTSNSAAERDNVRAQWSLTDGQGSSLPLALWGALARRWCADDASGPMFAPGDVVFIRNVTIKPYNGNLTGNVSDLTRGAAGSAHLRPEIQPCWRSHTRTHRAQPQRGNTSVSLSFVNFDPQLADVYIECHDVLAIAYAHTRDPSLAKYLRRT